MNTLSLFFRDSFLLIYLILFIFLSLEQWTVESSASPSILLLSFRFLYFFWMLLMLVTVNKLNHIACHRTHTSQVATLKTLVTQTFLVCPMEKTFSFTRVLITNLWNICKTFCQSALLRGGEKKKDRILQSFFNYTQTQRYSTKWSKHTHTLWKGDIFPLFFSARRQDDPCTVSAICNIWLQLNLTASVCLPFHVPNVSET